MITNEIMVGKHFKMKVNFNLVKKHGSEKRQIWLTATIKGDRCRVFTGERIEEQYWQKSNRTELGERAIENSQWGRVVLDENRRINKRLDAILDYCREYAKLITVENFNSKPIEFTKQTFEEFMKNKIRHLLFLSVILFSVASCTDDKGNYDYKTMYAIEIDGIDENKKYELWFGEPFTMPEPIIRFTDSTQAHDDLSYQWKLDTFVVSTEKCLNVTFGIEPQGWNDIFGAFIVKDERTGISYSQRFRVTLLSNFTNGWMWMTENQGKAELNMLASSKKFFQNVYTAVNNRELGPKAYGVVEHFDAGLNANGVLVMAGGPGSDGPVELDWSNLRKEVWTGEEFVGGSLPEDLQEIKAACFIKNYSCLVSGSGKLYVRYSPGGYLYQDRYPDFPFYGDYKLSSVVGYSFPPDYNVALFYEENEGRYLFLDNGELRGLDQVEDAGQKFSLVDPDKELIYLAPASQQQGKSLFYAVLRDKSDGKYYTQRFQFGIVGGQPTLTTIAQDVFPAVVNEKTRFAVGYTTKEAYYSQGAQIFRYNFELNDTPVAVADFKTGTITAFTLDSYGEQFGVCVQNGNTHDFYWTSTDGQEFEHVKQIPGEVKGLIYKSGGSWKYE